MKRAGDSLAIRASAIVVDPRTVVRDTWLVVRAGRVAGLLPGRRQPRSARRLLFQEGVVIPGLVNAHTHLELTGFPTRRPPRGRLDLWLAQIIGNKKGWSAARAARAVRRGASLCLRSGTTTVGEIESLGVSALALRRLRLRATVYREIVGLDPGSIPERLQWTKRYLGRPWKGPIRFGVSPHAPYSVSAELMRELGALVRERQAPMGIHLAESRGELDFLREGRGHIVELLRRKGKLPSFFRAPGTGPLRYLNSLGLISRRTLLVHGNYLDPIEIRELGRRGIPVAFCPGSHDYFRYDAYPLLSFLRAGVPLALGTDSLASNRELDLLREMALVRRRFPSVTPRTVFEMATLNGARALGWEDRVGALHDGKDADFVLLDFKAPGLSDEEVYDRVTAGRPRVLRTYVRGRRVW